MAWQHHTNGPPPPYGYDASPYPGYPGPPPPHQEQRVGPPPGIPYGPPPPGGAPPGYGPPPPRQSPHSMPPPLGHEYWSYDHQQRGPYSSPSPWRPEHLAEGGKFDRSRDPYKSPPENRSYPPYYHHASSTRGGRRPDSRHQPTPKGPTYPPPPSHPYYAPDSAEAQRSSESPKSKEREQPLESQKPSTSPKEKEKNDNKKGEHRRSASSDELSDSKTPKKKGKKDGDPLSLLANVSSEVDRKKGSQKGDAKSKTKKSEIKEEIENDTTANESTGATSSPLARKVPPASPVQRRMQSSPIITPNASASTDEKDEPEPEQPSATKQRAVRTLTPKPITPTGASHYHHPQQPPPPSTPSAYPHYDDRGPPRGPPYYGGPPPSHPGMYPPPYSYGPESREPTWEHPQHSPVVVERNSFDSGESRSAQRHPADYPYHPSYYGAPPPPPSRYYPGESPYPPDMPPSGEPGWQRGPYDREREPEAASPPSPRSSSYYLPRPGWYEPNQPPPSPGSHYPRPMPPYPYSGPPPRGAGYPTPSPYFSRPDMPPYEGPIGSPGGPPPYSPPQHMHYHMPPPGYPPHPVSGMPPYTYVQQPNMEEKTVLRKKFSWKHFPELERFLIENRDEYLQYSSRNYTVEQKQFNNHLTERLIELAEKHNYVFDPDDFNFVAIRDRIRCYYKSYVQTARKRGLSLPSGIQNKKAKTTFQVQGENALESKNWDVRDRGEKTCVKKDKTEKSESRQSE